jgi:hypothetical protein
MQIKGKLKNWKEHKAAPPVNQEGRGITVAVTNTKKN